MARAITPGDLGPFGNLFCRGMVFPQAGDFVELHAHSFDHVMNVDRGIVRVITEKNDEIVWSIEAAMRSIPDSLMTTPAMRC